MKQQFTEPLCDKCSSRLDNVFCSLSSAEVDDMNADKNCSIYKKGQVIFNEGNKPVGMFCVNKGKIKVFQTGEEGKEQIVRLAKEGDILGYRSLISGDPYSATATVLEDATVCFIPKTRFFDFLKSNSDLSEKMMQLLSHDLKDAEKKLTAIAQKPVRERVAEAIIMLYEFYGEDKDGAINSAVSREDIANIVGTATETTIRIISEFKSLNIIDTVGRKLKIIDREKLIKAAHIFD